MYKFKETDANYQPSLAPKWHQRIAENFQKTLVKPYLCHLPEPKHLPSSAQKQ